MGLLAAPPGRETRTRHLVTVGSVPTADLATAHEAWHPVRVDEALHDDDTVLVLVDMATASAPEYLGTLEGLSNRRLPFGMLPIAGGTSGDGFLRRRLEVEKLDIALDATRFRLMVSDTANDVQAPPMMRRVPDTAESAEGLREAEFLYLQGHSGPIDAALGRWFYLCSRHLHREGEARFYPCFGTDRCFRQRQFGRPEDSADGLVDPRTLKSSLMVFDGCSTFAVPGGLTPYATSLGRAFVESDVRAGVMTHGTSGMPFSGIVLLVVMLAEGLTLGEAVREANLHAHESSSPSSIEAGAASPLVVVGNPEVTVDGLRLLAPRPEPDADGIAFDLDEADISAAAGALVRLDLPPAPGQGWDVVEGGDFEWAHGVVHRDDSAYVWVSKATGGDGSSDRSRRKLRVEPTSARRAVDWQGCFAALHASSGWLGSLADAVEMRGGDGEPLRSLRDRLPNLIRQVEAAAGAADARVRRSVAPWPDAGSAKVLAEVQAHDQLAAEVVAAGLAAARIRTFNLWSPPLINLRSVDTGERCVCDARIVANVARHATVAMVRWILSCPGCGAISDAAGRSGEEASEAGPEAVGYPLSHRAVTGDLLRLPVRLLGDRGFQGSARSALADQFRERSVLSEVAAVEAGGERLMQLEIPESWPPGLAQAVTVVSCGGSVSFLDFDLLVLDRPPR
jgi:hypothetical protein